MALQKVYNGASWDTVVAKTYDGAVWQEKKKFWDGTAWVELYGGDVINLINISSTDEGFDGATAQIRCYNVGTREGEAWFDDGGFTYSNDVIVPGSNANLYQMKWVLLSGDTPDSSSSASGVWQALTAGDFWVEWTADGENESAGTVTVSIRKGTGSVLDTASWFGEAISTLE